MMTASGSASRPRSAVASKRRAPDERLDARRRDVLDVAGAVVELLDLGGVDVEADDPEADLAEAQHQRQADIAEPDDPDRVLRRAILSFSERHPTSAALPGRVETL